MMGVYQIIPPDWKYSLNVTVIAVGIPGEPCKFASFFTTDFSFSLYVSYLNGELVIRYKLDTVTHAYTHPIIYNQVYSIEIQNRYQGRVGDVNEWKLTVHIDGIQVYQQIEQNLKLLRDIKYSIGHNDVCTATIEYPEFKIIEQGI